MKYLIGIIFVILFLTSCDLSNQSSSSSKASSYLIKYEVVGSGQCTAASLTYENSSDGTSQISASALPWTYSFTVNDISQFLYISAQNNFDSGSVTTRIYVNGSVKKESTSTGAYVIATCSGSIETF